MADKHKVNKWFLLMVEVASFYIVARCTQSKVNVHLVQNVNPLTILLFSAIVIKP